MLHVSVVSWTIIRHKKNTYLKHKHVCELKIINLPARKLITFNFPTYLYFRYVFFYAWWWLEKTTETCSITDISNEECSFRRQYILVILNNDITGWTPLKSNIFCLGLTDGTRIVLMLFDLSQYFILSCAKTTEAGRLLAQGLLPFRTQVDITERGEE